jgi:hypothetical protein
MFEVPAKHLVVVHFVDVVGGENQDDRELLLFDALNILINRVRVPQIPGFANPLRGWKNIYEFIEFCRQYVSGVLDVPIATQGFVLRQDVDLSQAGIDAVERGISMRR